jgi:hypothetical protein
MLIILRPIGNGNWSPIRVAYDPARHERLPTRIQVKVNDRMSLAGVTYRVSRVLA